MIPRPTSKNPIPAHATKVFSGVLFDVYQWQQEMFDGSVETFEKLRRLDTASVVPILENGNILVITDEQPGSAPAPTFPGGRLDLGEDPEAGILRELMEETGYAPASVTLWSSEQPITKIDWAWYSFIARGCKKVAEPHLDAGEKITVREVTFDELLELVDTPEFQCQNMRPDFVRAKYDAEARKKLEKLLFG